MTRQDIIQMARFTDIFIFTPWLISISFKLPEPQKTMLQVFAAGTFGFNLFNGIKDLGK